MPETVIEAQHLVKVFNAGRPNQVAPVRNISLKVQKGECIILKGPSGSGKSTLLTLLGCLSRPTSGEYYCLGQKVSRWSEKFLTLFRRKHIGIVFQHFHLVSGLTTLQNISLPLLPTGLPEKETRARAEEAANAVQITHRLHFKANTLSGGEMQRVAIARALVNRPPLIFADEPTAHLDSKMSADVLAVFEKLKAGGATLVITTHDPAVEHHPMRDRVLVVQDGQLDK